MRTCGISLHPSGEGESAAHGFDQSRHEWQVRLSGPLRGEPGFQDLAVVHVARTLTPLPLLHDLLEETVGRLDPTRRMIDPRLVVQLDAFEPGEAAVDVWLQGVEQRRLPGETKGLNHPTHVFNHPTHLTHVFNHPTHLPTTKVAPLIWLCVRNRAETAPNPAKSQLRGGVEWPGVAPRVSGGEIGVGPQR